jgi:hypothetical protein
LSRPGGDSDCDEVCYLARDGKVVINEVGPGDLQAVWRDP